MTTFTVLVLMAGTMTTILIGGNEIMTKAQEAGIIHNLVDWQWATFTIAGAMLASVISMLYRTESWKERVGNTLMAAVVGAGLPRFLSHKLDFIKEWTSDPIILTSIGFACGMAGFAISKWLVYYMGTRAPQVAETAAENWMHRRLKNERERKDLDREEGL